MLSLTAGAAKPSTDDLKAYQEALENYRAIYKELISKYLDDPNSGFNRKYWVGDKEDTLYSRSTEKDIALYAGLCALAYTDERSDFNKIQEEINNGLKSLDLDGHKLLGLLKRNIKTKPALSAIVLYNPQKNHMIIAFKGTVDKDNYDDWKKNLSFFAYSGPDPLRALFAPDGFTRLNVHNGFASAYLEGIDDFLPDFRKLVSEYAEQIKKHSLPLVVTYTGHSLGGALSEIAANDGPRIFRQTGLSDDPKKLIIENISFAAPRVYDAKSARIVENAMGGVHNILRFVDIADPVPTVPWTILGSDHIGIDFRFGKSVYTYDVGKHSMTNYVANAAKTFEKFKSDAQYLRYVLDSIAHYKGLLGDTTKEPYELLDRINSIKVAMQQNKITLDFWMGKIIDEKDVAKVQELASIRNAIDPEQKRLQQELKEAEDQLKALKPSTKSWWWPF